MDEMGKASPLKGRATGLEDLMWRSDTARMEVDGGGREGYYFNEFVITFRMGADRNEARS